MIEALMRAATCSVSCGANSGTGHLVREDRVLTAFHCVSGASENNETIVLRFSSLTGGDAEIQVIASLVDSEVELDIAVLSIAPLVNRQPLAITTAPQREGVDWLSFGFPAGKVIGHRLSGQIQQVLSTPRAKIDVDLSVTHSAQLDSYSGMSGAAVVVEGRSCGLVRLRHNGGIAAISMRAIQHFLDANEIPLAGDQTRAIAR